MAAHATAAYGHDFKMSFILFALSLSWVDLDACAFNIYNFNCLILSDFI